MKAHDTFTPVQQLHRRLGHLLRAQLVIEPLARAPLPGGSFRSFASPSISVIAVHGAPIDIRKAPSATSNVHLLRVLQGSVHVTHERGEVRLGAGQFVAYRGARALGFRHEHSAELLTVMLPARTLERWLPDWQAAELMVARADGEAHLSFELARELTSCRSQLQDGTSALIAETVARLAARALAAVALHDASVPRDAAEAQRRRVRQFCRQHLDSTALGVEAVARATGLSRATLHRLFRDQPQRLMQWVQLERLEACKRLLEEPGLPLRSLTEIALAHGFKSSAHFSASFRRRYGLCPRDYRRAVRRSRP